MTNKELIEIWYFQMWNKWDKSVFNKILCNEISFRGSLGQSKKGHKGISEYIDFVRQAFPDFHNQIDLIISENNKSFVKLTYTGTHQGEIFNMLPTNLPFAYTGAAVFTFNDNKISDVWVLGDV